MLKNSVAVDPESAVTALTPDLLTKMRREDMKQAIFERFSYRAKPAAKSETAALAKVRSPYWQPIDEEC